MENQKDFICPSCQVTQTKIGVTSEQDQEFDLETLEYQTIDQVGDTLYCFCLNCGEELPKDFMELLD